MKKLTFTILALTAFIQLLYPVIAAVYVEQTDTMIGETRVETIDYNIVLNKSYYISHVDIPSTNQPFYWNTLVYGYWILSFDGDKYPDILLWTLKKIMIWSYNKGLYRSVETDKYYDRPIPVDVDHDGVYEEIILLSHPGYDSKTYPITYNPRLKTRIEIWDIGSDTVENLGSIYSIALSRTYVIYGDKVYIPAVKNTYTPPYPPWGLKTLYSTLGLLVVDTGNRGIKYYTLKTLKIRDYYRATDDVTTSYEAYILPYRKGKVVVFTSGWDRLEIVSLKPYPHIIKEINLQENPTPRDSLMIYARREVLTHSPEAYTLLPLHYDTPRHYWSPQQLDYYISDGKLIVPYGGFSQMTPLSRIYGRFNGRIVYDNPRVEKILGVLVVDLDSSTYRYYRFRDKTVENYRIRSITGLEIIDDKHIHVGAIAYDTRRKTYWSILLEYIYNPVEDEWIPRILYKALYSNPAIRSLPVIPFNKTYGLTPAYIVANKTIIKYHTTKARGGPGYTYLLNPVILHRPAKTDIDGDGVEELVNIIQYQQPCGTAWGDPEIYYLVPGVRNGWIKLLIVDKPSIHVSIRGIAELGSTIQVSLSSKTTSQSRINISIMRNGEEIYATSLKGGENKTIQLKLEKPGRYILSVKSWTIYWANHTLGNEKLAFNEEKITYYEEINKTLITIKIPTRVRIAYPTPNLLTPNLYIDGLTIKAILQYYNRSLNTWINHTLTDKLLAEIRVDDTVYTVELTPGGRDGLYTGLIDGLNPGENVSVTVIYPGDTYYTSSNTTKTYSLIKYPTKIIVVSKPAEIPALTSTNVEIEARYLYVDRDGSLMESEIDYGFLKVTYRNKYIARTWTGILRRNIVIPWYISIPPRITLELTYTPLNTVYYEKSSNTTTIDVHRIKLDAVYNKTMIYGEKTRIEIIEIYGSNGEYRSARSPLKASIYNDTFTEQLKVDKGSIIIDTTRLKPGNYTIEVSVDNTYYASAYINPTIYLEASIIALRYEIIVKPEIPAAENTGGTIYTYTLIPVKIIVLPKDPGAYSLDNSIKISLYIDDVETTIHVGEEYTAYFKDPGHHVVEAGIKGLKIGLKKIIAYPHPVRIIFYSIGDKLYVKPVDLYGRIPPGKIMLKIHRGDRVVDQVEEYIDGNTTIYRFTGLPPGIYYVEAIYVGNRSYTVSSNYTVVEKYRSINPLPETPYTASALTITLLSTIYIINRQRRYSKGRG